METYCIQTNYHNEDNDSETHILLSWLYAYITTYREGPNSYQLFGADHISLGLY